LQLSYYYFGMFGCSEFRNIPRAIISSRDTLIRETSVIPRTMVCFAIPRPNLNAKSNADAASNRSQCQIFKMRTPNLWKPHMHYLNPSKRRSSSNRLSTISNTDLSYNSSGCLSPLSTRRSCFTPSSLVIQTKSLSLIVESF
jgi:hypothetical protein